MVTIFTNEEFIDFLEYSSELGFKFKFLNFEPILPEHIKKVISFSKVENKLIEVGCFPVPSAKSFRGQINYLPIRRFNYKNVKGVAIEIGCGNAKVCKNCYCSNEIFVTPDFKIKPCHISDFKLNLEEFIKSYDVEKILDLVLASRKFLTTAPGADIKIWQQTKKGKI